MSLKDLATQLSGLVQDGFALDVLPIQKGESGEISVLQVTVEGFDELPIFVTATDEQILCVTNLFTKSEIKAELENELNAMLLRLTVNVPLSSFGMIDEQYILFGAMGVNTIVENIAHELVTQAENSLEALDALEEFLK
ncbi:DUF2170 family protein [Aliikangiella maris]|uniref:DUF2170 family protein n=2 Tax=Aliikangiella maris TaxID=3162458 RepID=A0ABV3MM96_9GAMM